MNPPPLVRFYYAPLSFPCGPQSSCCGPTGQSEEDLNAWVNALKTSLPGLQVETIDATSQLDPQRDQAAMSLLNTFGAAACPLVAVDGEVVSMGPPKMDELTTIIRSKLPALT